MRAQMRVAVCDDSLEDLEKIKGLLINYRERNKDVQLETKYFTDSAELYHQIQAKAHNDIYILDIIMSKRTGIDIGKLIHDTDENTVIIYITSSDDFAFEAYRVHAVRYLLKPVQDELFVEALDYAVANVSEGIKNPIYTVKTKDGLVSVPCSKIEYIENYSRILNVCLTDGKVIQSIFIRKSFDEETRQLAGNDSFIQVHKSFLVNLYHVDRLAHGNIIMESGAIIPISKARTADVKKEYLKFVSEQY